MKKLLLSLGALSAVVAPVAAVVACGSSNEIGIERGDLINAINHSGLTPDQVTEYLAKAKNAKSTSEISKIHEKINDMFNVNSKDNSQWSKPRGDAKLEINMMTTVRDGDDVTVIPLPKESATKYNTQIDKATSQDAIDAIIAQAHKEKDDLHLKAEIARDAKTYESELDSKLFTSRDWIAGTKDMEQASDMKGFTDAYEALKLKINNPEIKKAKSTGFVIVTGVETKGDVKLYIPNNKIGTKVTWIDTSVQKDQDVVEYEIVKNTSGTDVHVQVKVNGKVSSDHATIEDIATQHKDDNGIVLSDMSGDIWTNGAKDVDSFSKNLDVINFFKRSMPALGKRSAKVIDIIGMKELLANGFENIDATAPSPKTITFDGTKIQIN